MKKRWVKKNIHSMLTEQRKKKALEESIKDGCANGATSGFSDTYISPFALALGASSFAIGFLNAAIGLLGPLAQFWGSKHTYNDSRKKVLRKYILSQALLFLPLALIAIYVYLSNNTAHLVYPTILVYLIIYAVGSIPYPAWFSWMGDLVNKKKHGEYFGKRNTLVGIANLIAIVIGAIILDSFKNPQQTMIGFALIYLLALMARFACFYYLGKQYEPKNKEKFDNKISFKQFLREDKNLTRFVRAIALFNFAIMVASPFFVVYMLKTLGFSYIMYMLVSVSGILFYLAFMPPLGKFADKYGSTFLLRLSCLLFTLGPVFWILTKNPIIIIIFVQLVSGLANAAMTVSTTNLSYDLIPKKERSQYISYINVIVGMGIFVGSLLGGALLKYLPQNSSIFLTLFAIAAVLRGLVSLIFMSKIKEAMPVKRMPSFSMDLLHPIKAMHADTHFVKHIIGN
jgi:MFS family permease